MMYLDRLAGQSALWRRTGPLSRRYLARARNGARQVHIYYYENRIAFTQIYPFLHHNQRFAERHGITFRLFPVTPALEGQPIVGGADHVLFQCWFDVDGGKLERTLEAVRKANPQATLDFIDGFAPNDLRLARHVDPYIRYYLKKSLFKDRAEHTRVWRGDTNITEYVTDLFDLDTAPVDYGVPDTILPKLKLTPNFFTSPKFLTRFLKSDRPPANDKPIDVHARMKTPGGAREKLRKRALDRLQKVPGTHIISETGLRWPAYMAEMRKAKICFSPFGFGELCWRDMEAFLAGAVMVKPDMSHLETLPDLYEAGETYMPVAWDFSDLDTVITQINKDADLRHHITTTSWRRVHDYLKEERFVDDMAPLWDSAS